MNRLAGKFIPVITLGLVAVVLPALPGQAGVQSGKPNCQGFFLGGETRIGPNGEGRGKSTLRLDVAHINDDRNKTNDSGGCVELADVGVVKSGGSITHAIYIPFKYDRKQKVVPLAKASVSVRYGLYFVANAKGTTSEVIAGNIEISPNSIGLGGSNERTYQLLRDKRKGKVGKLAPAAFDADCVVAADSDNKQWFIACPSVSLPYDEATYRWPNGRNEGGLQVVSLWSSMSVNYAGGTYTTSGEAILRHEPCYRVPGVPEFQRCHAS